MKHLLAALLIVGPHASPLSWLWHASSHPFVADTYLTVGLDYQSATVLAGVSTYGPTPKAVMCERAEAAFVAESKGMEPPGHTAAATCLHVRFSGPAPKGQVVMQPGTAKPIAVVLIGVEYDSLGKWYGAEALHSTDSAKVCEKQANVVLADNLKNGRVPKGNTLLIYCLPVPALPAQKVPRDDSRV